MLLKDKVAVVTGGAKGMGKGISLTFAEEGCAVVVSDIDIEGARGVAAEIVAQGGRALAIKADITKSAEVQNMVDQTTREFGGIDILVNNAGGVPGTKGSGNSDTISEEEWDRIIELNLKGPFLVCRAVLPGMKKNRYGKIINLSSMGAVSPAVSVLHYHAAKAGVLGLTLNLAFELAPQGVYVNAIVPGPVETPFWDALMPAGPERDKFLTALAKHEVPIGRIGTPQDIANVALFLASRLSDYMTGQVLCVAGGQPMLSQASTFNIEAHIQNLGK
jgi:NAD(P)-dependent dehydrogenase (short-subunit alcohol dehydrogenase family)